MNMAAEAFSHTDYYLWDVIRLVTIMIAIVLDGVFLSIAWHRRNWACYTIVLFSFSVIWYSAITMGNTFEVLLLGNLAACACGLVHTIKRRRGTDEFAQPPQDTRVRV